MAENRGRPLIAVLTEADAMPDPFPAALRRLRLARGLTVGALAGKLECTSAFVSRMEAGASKPSLQTLRRLADTLSVTLDELTGRTPGE